MQSYYVILGCDITATTEDLKRKYQALALKHHPDKQKLSSNIKSDSFVQINEAWKTLGNPELRKAYDSKLMQAQLNSKPLLFAMLEESELDWNPLTSTYSYGCRCGGTYVVHKEDIPSEECLVQCGECSLAIHTKWKSSN